MDPEIITYDETLTLLHEVVDWLQKMGIDARGRVDETVRRLQVARDAWSAGLGDRFIDSPEKFEMFVNVFYQAVELVNIYQTHKAATDAWLPGKLGFLVKGAMLLSEERVGGSATVGRDTAFELVLSGMFRKLGIPTTLEDPTDLKIEHDGHVFLLECKRPQSRDGVQGSIAKARRQLNRKLGLVHGAKGVIAISASKLLNPGDRLLHVARRVELPDALSRVGLAQTELIKEYFRNLEDRKIVGVIVHLALPALVTAESALPVYCTQPVYYPSGKQGQSRDRFLALAAADPRGSVRASELD